MLNIKAEYENNIKLKKDLKLGWDTIKKSEYRIFLKENDYKENEKIIEKNVGLPRALRSIAWGEWFCKGYSDGISENEKVEKIKNVMKEWHEEVYAADTSNEKVRENLEQYGKEGQREALYAKNSNYYVILCEAIALGRDGLGTGKMEIPKIEVPLRIIQACIELKICEEKLSPSQRLYLVMLVIYYHYAFKDEEGYIVLEQADFGKWAIGTTKYDKVLTDLRSNGLMEYVIQEKKISSDKKEERKKIKIMEELTWKDGGSNNVKVFIDDGVRGMSQQVEDTIDQMLQSTKSKKQRK